MIVDIVVRFVQILANVLIAAVIIRALASWFMPDTGSGIMRVLFDITEPILAPIRRILPTFGGIDASPIVAMIVIYLVSNVLISLIQTTG